MKYQPCRSEIAFCENFLPENYLASLDKLHALDHQKWNEIFKTPIKRWMEKEEEE